MLDLHNIFINDILVFYSENRHLYIMEVGKDFMFTHVAYKIGIFKFIFS
jgi:hypothetical protein